MLNSVYAQYENLYGISKQCDPICARPSTILFVDNTGQEQLCQSSVCIIDDVTLDFVQSSTGNISKTNICGGCIGAASCRCIISGITLSAAQSGVGNISLSNNCQGALECYQPNPNNPNGPAIQVNCEPPYNPVSNQNTTNTNQTNPQVTTFLYIALGLHLILALSLLLLFSYNNLKKLLKLNL